MVRRCALADLDGKIHQSGGVLLKDVSAAFSMLFCKAYSTYKDILALGGTVVYLRLHRAGAVCEPSEALVHEARIHLTVKHLLLGVA